MIQRRITSEQLAGSVERDQPAAGTHPEISGAVLHQAIHHRIGQHARQILLLKALAVPAIQAAVSANQQAVGAVEHGPDIGLAEARIEAVITAAVVAQALQSMGPAAQPEKAVPIFEGTDKPGVAALSNLGHLLQALPFLYLPQPLRQRHPEYLLAILVEHLHRLEDGRSFDQVGAEITVCSELIQTATGAQQQAIVMPGQVEQLLLRSQTLDREGWYCPSRM